MNPELNTRLDDLEKRIKFQEQVHNKINPDGNYYHTIFRDGRWFCYSILISVSLSIAFGFIIKGLK